MKPEAQASETDAGRGERAHGTVLMLIGFSVGFAVCYLLVTPVMNSPSTVTSPSAVSARVYTHSFLPLARRPEADTHLMTYEYRVDAFQPYLALPEIRMFCGHLRSSTRTNGGKSTIKQAPDEYYQKQQPLLDAPSPGDWQQPRSLHLIDQRPARELVSVAQ